MKTLSILLLVLSSLTISATAAEPIRWAADTESGAPLVFQDPKEPEKIIGFEREVIEGIAKRIGRPAVLVHNAWDGLIPGLARGNYDVIINGLEITDERRKEILFSDPYFITFQQLTVRKEENNLNSLETARGRRVGTLKNSLTFKLLEEFGGINVVTYDTEPSSYEDLTNGRIDAVLLDAPGAMYRRDRIRNRDVEEESRTSERSKRGHRRND